MEEVKELTWHDAILLDINIHLGNANSMIIIKALVYLEPDSLKRDEIQLSLEGVRSLNLNCDFLELEDNRQAGNIGNGYAKKSIAGDLSIRLFLIDGYIEVNCKSIKITQNA